MWAIGCMFKIELPKTVCKISPKGPKINHFKAHISLILSQTTYVLLPIKIITAIEISKISTFSFN